MEKFKPFDKVLVREHLLGTADTYKPKYEPKDGDFVYCRGNAEHILIFNRIEDDCIYVYIELSDKTFLREKAILDLESMYEIRPATEEEKHQLLSKLEENGKEWDESKKEIVECKWKPVDGEEYHYCKYNDELNEFEVETTKWYALSTDTNRRKANNCFKEFIECSNACDRMNESFKELLKGGK